MDNSTGFESESGSFSWAAAVVQQKGSLIRTGTDVAGVRGIFWLFEHPGPEQGKS
jgi:hypothetical protein